jgi:hypothetical protein
MSLRRITLFITVALFVVISAGELRAQSREEAAEDEFAVRLSEAERNNFCDALCRLNEQRSQRLEGSWDISVTLAVPPGVPQPPSFVAHGTFARGGAAWSSDRTRPFSKQHGAWEHTGGSGFAFTVTEDLFNEIGQFAGTVKVRVRLRLIGNDEFVGVSNGEYRDAAGNVTRSGCGTVKGQRIKVEPLPETCQNILPPQ